ncbi:MAG TPA: putative peptidoglycan glycosyltransferase FtsW [Candidatus Paceibacterota bacterium]|jgi:cell division protein FtsW|nr:putative peptidoglycan glycosyltransferase FtsW [Candidatus Paceibacterota bacterium]
MKRAGKIDKPFLIAVIILVVAGYFIFSSASLGLLASQQAKYSNVAFNQTFFGLFLGSIACIITSRLDYRIWRKYSLILFVLSAIMTLLVFVPHIGFSHGGATRWINLGVTTFQPSELLKISFIFYFSAWIAKYKDKVNSFKYGFLPFLVLIGIVGAILIKQPDTGTFAVTFAAGLAIYLVAGASWLYLLLLVAGSALGLFVIAKLRPYVMARFTTFLDPSADALGAGYQLQQSLIAIGSGRFLGRGFGQSIQKFNYLPEPIGDSIFAVMSEEFGFLGSVTLVLLFLFLTVRGLKIAATSPDTFGRLVTVGIVILIISQAFINMGGMLAIMPLKGITLPLVSQGGTALFMTLAEIGIIVNISKFSKESKESA